MSIGIPFRDKGHEPLSQVIQVGEIADTKPLALYDTEPLIDLVHPGTMHRNKVAHEARVSSQPGPNLLSFMHAQVIHHQENARRGWCKLSLQLGKEGKKLNLPFAHLGSSVDLACAGIKSGKQVQGSGTLILVLQASRQTRSCGERDSQAGTWLKIGFFIETEDHLLFGQRTSVELDQGLDQMDKVIIAGRFGGKPEVVSPRFELMGAQDTFDGIG